MEKAKKLNGRPPKTEGKRVKFVNVRFTEEEYKLINDLEKTLGMSKTDLIRHKVLSEAGSILINAGEMIRSLDDVGAEMGRIGNNVNQLARHANTLNLQGHLSPSVAGRYNDLLEQYIRIQELLEATMRKMIRQLGT